MFVRRDFHGKFGICSTLKNLKSCAGLRQLKSWLLGPSCVAEEIEARWDAVGELMENFSLLKKLKERLKKLPDMDKMLARIHSLSLKKVEVLGNSIIMVPGSVLCQSALLNELLQFLARSPGFSGDTLQ